MDAIYRIRLVGGPYDGDQDDLDVLPPYLWAFLCTCHPPRERAAINGIHWAWGNDKDHGSLLGAEEYRYSFADTVGHVYTWAPIVRERFQALRRAILA